MTLEALEPRTLMSAGAPPALVTTNTPPIPSPSTSVSRAVSPTPAITLADRWELLANWSSPVSKSLKYRLKANDAAGFDQMLLDYMAGRTGPRYFFDPTDVPAYVSFIAHDTSSHAALHAQAAYPIDRADDVLAHRFPEQVNSDPYTVPLPAGTIDWDAQPATTDAPDFLHALNRHGYWDDLAVAYRLTDDRAYARELCAQLASWFAQNPPLANPDDWPTSSPRWWLLDAADRVDHWTRSYFLMLGSRGLTPEANTIFLAGLLRHGDFLARVTPRSTASNWTTLHGSALALLGTVFPEFTAAADWKLKGQDLLLRCLDRQFFPDGGHVEQSPAYAASAAEAILENYQLAKVNADPLWTRARRRRLTGVVEALFQMVEPDSKLPALSDTYSASTPAPFLGRASAILGEPRFGEVSPTLDDVWLLGPDVLAPRLNQPALPPLEDRGAGYALGDAGYYMMRTRPKVADGLDQTQVTFDAGPTGGTHGHADLFNVLLTTRYGSPLVDPGPARYDDSADRRWAVSTPAHNTVSIDALSHAPVAAPHDPQIGVDAWEVADDHVLVTAHHRAYAALKGSPVVGRSVWLDRTTADFSAMLIVDWGQAAATHTYTTSLNLPWALSQLPKMRDGVLDLPSGADTWRVQSVPMPGQTISAGGTFVTPDPPPAPKRQAARLAIGQTGRSAVFVTMVGFYAGSDPAKAPTATLDAPIRAGRAVRIRLHVDGQPDRVVAIAPPDLTPLAPSSPSAAPAVVPRASPPAAGRPFSVRAVSAAGELFGEPSTDPLADARR